MVRVTLRPERRFQRLPRIGQTWPIRRYLGVHIRLGFLMLLVVGKHVSSMFLQCKTGVGLEAEASSLAVAGLNLLDERYSPTIGRAAREWITPFRQAFPDVPQGDT